jgi:hypothetical protein
MYVPVRRVRLPAPPCAFPLAGDPENPGGRDIEHLSRAKLLPLHPAADSDQR